MAYSYFMQPSVPQDTGEKPSLGASRIRDLKNAIIERLNSWVYGFDTAGTESDLGLKFAPFVKQTSSPSTVSNKLSVFSKLASSVLELFVRDENDNDIQLTENGHIYAKDASGNAFVVQSDIDDSIADCVDTTRTPIDIGTTYQATDYALFVGGSVELEYTPAVTYDKDYTYTLSVSSSASFDANDIRCKGTITQYKDVNPQVSGKGTCTLCAFVPKDYYYKIERSDALINATQTDSLFTSKLG